MNYSPIVDTKQLLAELARTKNRNRQLEEALRISHSKQSSRPHPLLQYSSRAYSSGDPCSTAIVPPLADPEHDLLEILGTLTIADDGESRFLGPSAASEVRLQVKPDLFLFLMHKPIRIFSSWVICPFLEIEIERHSI